jgi:hypothetical protein
VVAHVLVGYTSCDVDDFVVGSFGEDLAERLESFLEVLRPLLHQAQMEQAADQVFVQRNGFLELLDCLRLDLTNFLVLRARLSAQPLSLALVSKTFSVVQLCSLWFLIEFFTICWELECLTQLLLIFFILQGLIQHIQRAIVIILSALKIWYRLPVQENVASVEKDGSIVWLQTHCCIEVLLGFFQFIPMIVCQSSIIVMESSRLEPNGVPIAQQSLLEVALFEEGQP